MTEPNCVIMKINKKYYYFPFDFNLNKFKIKHGIKYFSDDEDIEKSYSDITDKTLILGRFNELDNDRIEIECLRCFDTVVMLAEYINKKKILNIIKKLSKEYFSSLVQG